MEGEGEGVEVVQCRSRDGVWVEGERGRGCVCQRDRQDKMRSLISKYLDIRESMLSHHGLGDNAREGNHR